MLVISVSERFVKRYDELPREIQRKIEKQEKLFCANPFHPSLNTEKLNPKVKQIWSFRVDLKYRVVFKFIADNHVFLITVGPHDWVYKLKF